MRTDGSMPLFNTINAGARRRGSENSIEAARELNRKGRPNTQAKKIHKTMLSNPTPATHSQIALRCGFKDFQLQIVSKRLAEMERHNLVERKGNAICPITKKRATLWIAI